jgi:hypothetical protein
LKKLEPVETDPEMPIEAAAVLLLGVPITNEWYQPQWISVTFVLSRLKTIWGAAN